MSPATIIVLLTLSAIAIGTIILANSEVSIFQSLKDLINGGNKEGNRRKGLFDSPNGISIYWDPSYSYNKKFQAVGPDFPQKNSILIVDKNEKLFDIDDNGKIEGVAKEDFPLYYSFKEPIINGSNLFKDVKFIKIIDLSKMNSSQMTDASSMFENSNVEEIFFASEKDTSNSEYFNTTKIKNVSKIFLNCGNLKKLYFLLFSMLVKMQVRCLKVDLS